MRAFLKTMCVERKSQGQHMILQITVHPFFFKFSVLDFLILATF